MPAPVIVIDLETGMFDGACEPPIHDAVGLVLRARSVLKWARRTGRKVAFIRHDGPAGDSLFSNPKFGEWVASQGTDEVILLGAQTEHCVAATVTGALQAGLRVTIVSDAHSTWDQGNEKAEAIIARSNAAFAKAGANLVATESLIAV